MTRRSILCTLLMVPFTAACGGDDVAFTPDANPDVAMIPGDYSCSGQPLPATAADPLAVRGLAIDRAEAGVGGVAVAVHSAIDDALLGTTTSTSTNVNRGKYSVNVATGGIPPRTYRKLELAGYVSAYGYDPRPVTADSIAIATLVLTAAQIDHYYQAAGQTRDPSKGTVWLDVSDCTPSYIAGATVDAPSGTVIYLDDALEFDASLTATRSGAVMVLNATPGEVDLTVHAGPITYASWPLTVRADVLTQSDRLP